MQVLNDPREMKHCHC